MNYGRRALVVSAILVPGITAVVVFRAYMAGYFDFPRAGAAAKPPALAVAVEPAPPAPMQAAEPSAPAPPPLSIEDRWGIKIIGASLSAYGRMVDFRYRVIDTVKAKPLFDRKFKPHLIDEATGRTFEVPNPPKVGPLRNSGQLAADRIYFVMFSNTEGTIKSKSLVTLVIGDFRAEHIVVE